MTPGRRLGAWIGCLTGALVLAGYATGTEALWRPVAILPATHPITALALSLLGLGMSMELARVQRWFGRALVIAATVALLPRAGTTVLGQSVFEALTPFQHVLSDEMMAGRPVGMGLNTVAAIMAIGIAEMLRWRRVHLPSQICAAGSLGICFVAIVGYLDCIPRFFGSMAPLTLAGTIPLGLVALSATPRRGFMRALTTQREPARLARLLLGVSTLAILLIEWFVSRHIDDPGVEHPASGVVLAYQTTSVVVLTWIVVIVCTMRADRIERRRGATERRLFQAAATDALTGLLGRGKMENLIKLRTQDPRSCAAMLYVDIDRFRSVNESLGPAAGDKMLIEVARRLRTIAGRSPIGRVGGDEFAVLCLGVTPAEADCIASRMTADLARPYEIGERCFHLSASVGVAHTDVAGFADLRQAADDAMFVAKGRGGRQSVTFERTMHVATQEQIELEQSLYDALERDDALSVVYQPIVSVSDQRLIAVEALARWTHPRLGAIEPDRFIPLAEATSLIGPLCEKLMTMTVLQTAEWHRRHGSYCPTININMPPVLLSDHNILDTFTGLLEHHALSPSDFCIEVTEGAFADARAVEALRQARRLGFGVSLDDFGVGYSSLSQLPRLPLVSVKLDRSFLVNENDHQVNATILSSIVQLAHGLDLQVIAEGVERPEHLQLVCQSGATAAQGFLVGRPMPAAELSVWLLGASTGSLDLVGPFN
jgi:diguanylate cyclase (GGDEF)-like protein